MPAELLDAGDPERRRRWRRWPWALLAVAVVVAGVVPAAQARIRERDDRAAVQRLAQLWIHRQVTAATLVLTIDTLARRASPADLALVRDATARLAQETADRLQPLRRAVDGVEARGRIATLRARIRAVLAADVAALERAGAGATPFQPMGVLGSAAADDVGRRLEAARRDLGVAEPRHPDVRLHGADDAFRRLDRLVDSPVRARLLVARDDGTSAVLDLATRRIAVGPQLGAPEATFARAGAVVIADLRSVRAIPVRDGRPARLLAAPPSLAFPGLRSDEVWVADERNVVRKVDLAGRRLVGPVQAPGTPYGETARGLVVGAESRGLAVWDPRTRRTRLRVGGGPLCAAFLAATRDAVVWRSCPLDRDAPVHLTDVRTGRDRVLAGVAPVPEGTLGTVSPDGRKLALVVPGEIVGTSRVAVVDLRTARGRAVPVPAHAIGKAVWTADSNRFFFSTAGLLAVDTATLWTYRVGERWVQAIRFRSRGGAAPVAVLR